VGHTFASGRDSFRSGGSRKTRSASSHPPSTSVSSHANPRTFRHLGGMSALCWSSAAAVGSRHRKICCTTVTGSGRRSRSRVPLYPQDGMASRHPESSNSAGRRLWGTAIEEVAESTGSCSRTRFDPRSRAPRQTPQHARDHRLRQSRASGNRAPARTMGFGTRCWQNARRLVLADRLPRREKHFIRGPAATLKKHSITSSRRPPHFVIGTQPSSGRRTCGQGSCRRRARLRDPHHPRLTRHPRRSPGSMPLTRRPDSRTNSARCGRSPSPSRYSPW